MTHQVTAYFDDLGEAEKAMSALQKAGVEDEELELHHANGNGGTKSDERPFMERVKDFFSGESQVEKKHYERGALLTVYDASLKTLQTIEDYGGYFQRTDEQPYTTGQ